MLIPNGQPANTGLPNEQEFEFSAEELEALDDKAKQAIPTLSAQKKHWREKAVAAQQELEKLKSATPPAPPVVPPTPAPQPQVDQEAVVRKVLMDSKRDEALASLPEDKRTAVKEVYSSLTLGKNIDSVNFGSYMEMAMNAVGVKQRVSTSNRITSAAPGAIPPKSAPGPTPAEIEMARIAGNDPNKVYGKDASLEGLHDAKRFDVANEEEFN
jgi:hypothetical protein